MERLGKYELLKELGRGAFGVVYLARDTVLNVQRAVKVLHPVLMADPEVVKRLYREAKVAARLEHPHIVTVYDFGEAEGRLYLVMRYMAGGSLQVRLAEEGPLPWPEVVRITREMAEALAHAHEHGVVHRDLKPGNVLFDAEGRVGVADFGLARVAGGSSVLTKTGRLVGTPAYMAPEVWKGEGVGPGADQYALACLVYEMVTGEVLFGGDTPWEVVARHREGPRFPDIWPEGVPEGLEAVLRKALAPEPGDRYPDVLAFAEALEDIASGRGPSVPEPKQGGGTPSRERRVAPGEDLAEVLAGLPEGGTLYLEAGVYRLRKPLHIERAVSLVGEDRDLTHIVWEGEGSVMVYRGAGVLRLRHLTLRKEGAGWGNVLEVGEGLVDLEDCRFTGGVWDKERKRGGVGLLLWRQAAGGRVVGCIFEGNGLHGIEVQEKARPVLRGNRCVGNRYDGIEFSGDSGGEAVENVCENNGLHGIEVQGKARPVLRGNRCVGNEWVGIWFDGDAGGEAEANVCENNGLVGISVWGKARPVLRRNRCVGNRQGGIVFFEDSGGEAVENVCENNGLHGIEVYQHARPVLRGNRCVGNKKSGIVFWDDSGGEAEANVCENNGWHGISVREKARPVLRGNRCVGNKEGGLYVAPTARPRIIGQPQCR